VGHPTKIALKSTPILSSSFALVLSQLTTSKLFAGMSVIKLILILSNTLPYLSKGNCILTDLSLSARPIMNRYRQENRLDDETHQLLLNLRIKTEPVIQYEASLLDVSMHELVICSKLDPGVNKNDFLRLQHRLYDKLANKDGLLEVPVFYNKLDLLTKLCIHPVTAYKDYQHLSAFKKDRNKYMFEECVLNPDDTIPVSRKISLVVTFLISVINTSVDEKAVIASSSKVILEKLEKLLAQSTTQDHTNGGFQTVRYDGDTSEKRRDEVLKRFQDAPSVRVLLLSCKAGKGILCNFLKYIQFFSEFGSSNMQSFPLSHLSIRTNIFLGFFLGGTALTLTSANHLFLMDPDWNPFNDRQTIGRLYRHGQKKTVFIYRLLLAGTIEEIKFINQLSKEEMDKFFKQANGSEGLAEQDGKLTVTLGEKDLLKYFPKTDSRINDLLESLNDQTEKVPEEEDGSFFEFKQFAEELAEKAQKYRTPSDVPDELKVLKDVWDIESSFMSFVFHCKKVRDPMELELFGIPQNQE
jgi:hypothetical protein